MNFKKKFFIVGLIILLATSSVFAGGKKETSSTNNSSNNSTSNNTTVQKNYTKTNYTQYGAWEMFFGYSNNSNCTQVFSKAYEVKYTTQVSVSAGTISLIEFEIGVTNGYEAIETDTYSFTVRPKTRLEGFKRPIITETVLLLQGTKLGSARYLSGADVKVNEYAL